MNRRPSPSLAAPPGRPAQDERIPAGVSTVDLETAFGRALERARAVTGGENTSVYPTLEAAPPDRFAAALHGLDGTRLAGGDTDAPFILMSVAKAFVLALAVDAHGRDAVLALTGMKDTGRRFNDPEAITGTAHGRTNPMVNPGAITAASLLGDARSGEAAIREGLSRLAGRPLDADPVMVDAIHATNHRNRELAGLLDARGLLRCGVEDALHLYTYQSCIEVTVEDLARMGAVLAADGVDEAGARVLSPEAARTVVQAMALAGLYEATPAWMATVGLPAKSGIAGGMVMIAPGRAALASVSPPLDPAGNPVRGQAMARELAPALR